MGLVIYELAVKVYRHIRDLRDEASAKELPKIEIFWIEGDTIDFGTEEGSAIGKDTFVR